MTLRFRHRLPDFLKGLFLIVPAAKSDANTQMIVDAMVAIVSMDPNWTGAYSQNPTAGLRAAGMLFTPWLRGQEQLSAMKTKEEYDRSLATFANGFAAWDAVSWMWRYLATREHDISQPFGGNVEAALGRIRAKALVMPSASDRLLGPAYTREIYRGIIIRCCRTIAGDAGQEKEPARRRAWPQGWEAPPWRP